MSHSYWPNILTLSQGVAFSQCPYDCCATALESASAKGKVQLFNCLPLQHHELLQACVLLASVFLHPGSTSSLVGGHFLIMYCLCIYNSASSFVATFMSSIDMHIGMSTVVSIICMLMFIPGSFWSLFSIQLWWDSQSAKYNSIFMFIFIIIFLYEMALD